MAGVGMKSPIEERFMAAFASLMVARGKEDRLFIELLIEAQAPIGNGLVDFAFEYLTAKLVVECDGHDFHEKTKQQASRDRARDREMQRLGYAVFRFTGHDLYWNAEACAQECIDYLVAKGEGVETENQRVWCLAYDHGWLHGSEKKPEPPNGGAKGRRARRDRGH